MCHAISEMIESGYRLDLLIDAVKGTQRGIVEHSNRYIRYLDSRIRIDAFKLDWRWMLK